MSAETLRKAAEKLREQATAATPGPWISEHHRVTTEAKPRGFNGICHVSMTTGNYQSEERNRRYIATMHPGVGLDLADVLDESAAVWDDIDVGTIVREDSQLDRLARLARLILGGVE